MQLGCAEHRQRMKKVRFKTKTEIDGGPFFFFLLFSTYGSQCNAHQLSEEHKHGLVVVVGVSGVGYKFIPQ